MQELFTPAHLAISRNSSDVLRELIEHNADLFITTPDGLTIFEIAVAIENFNIAEIIYKKTTLEFVQENFDKAVNAALSHIRDLEFTKIIEGLNLEDNEVHSIGDSDSSDSSTHSEHSFNSDEYFE